MEKPTAFLNTQIKDCLICKVTYVNDKCCLCYCSSRHCYHHQVQVEGK